MLRKTKDLFGMSLVTTNGTIGDVKDIYFDDEHWTIRYLVVNTGSWLKNQEVLISYHAITSFDPAKKQIHVNLTKEQVENSPDLDRDKPILRQQETALALYYGWPQYWCYPVLVGDLFHPASSEFGNSPLTIEVIEAAMKAEEEVADSHLRSLKSVKGNCVIAADGELGQVADFLFEDETRLIRYLVVATRSGLAGDQVLIAPNWIGRINWEDENVFVPLAKEVINRSPVYKEAVFPCDYKKQLNPQY